MVFGLMGLLLCACSEKCDPVFVDYGSLSEEVLGMVPYKEGETYRFKHSDGQVTSFRTKRELTGVNEYYENCIHVRREKDITLMSPDNPYFGISIEITHTDFSQVTHFATIGETSFLLPLTSDVGVDYIHFDSIRLDRTWFYDVYRIKRYHYDFKDFVTEKSGIADSLFYNTQQGIIRILMSAGDFYQAEVKP